MSAEDEATFLAGEDERTQAERRGELVVDPRDHHAFARYQQLGPLAAAVAHHDTGEDDLFPSLEGVLAAAREILAAAGVPTGPMCSCKHTIYQHDAATRCTAVEIGPVLCSCEGYDGDEFPSTAPAPTVPDLPAGEEAF